MRALCAAACNQRHQCNQRAMSVPSAPSMCPQCAISVPPAPSVPAVCHQCAISVCHLSVPSQCAIS
eukprot:496751-Prymnesium_polylepis.1